MANSAVYDNALAMPRDLQTSTHMQRSNRDSLNGERNSTAVDSDAKNSHATYLEYSPQRSLSSSTLADSDNDSEAFANEEEGLEMQELIQDDGKESDFSSQAREHRKQHKKQIQWTEHEERTIMRKLDRRLVMFLALLYLLSFLDRSSEFYFQSSLQHFIFRTPHMDPTG